MSSESTADMTLAVPESKSSIPTKEVASQHSVRKDDYLSEEESENAAYLLEIVTGTSKDSVTLMTETLETEHADILDTLDDLRLKHLPYTSGDEQHPLYCSAELFIDKFSKINIIRNDSASGVGQKKFDERASTWVATGNSRDAPSRFLFYCPNKFWGCDYNTPNNGRFGEHARKCKISEDNPVKPSTFKCRKLGCNDMIKSENHRNKHERDHGFVPRQCPKCTDGKWYMKEQDWRSHKDRNHDANWDTNILCQVEECTRKTGFPNRESFKVHLRGTHKMSAADVAKYVPEKKFRDPVWGKRSCPFPDCPRAAPGNEIGRKSEMEAHLKTAQGGHKCTPEKIKDLIDQILSG